MGVEQSGVFGRDSRLFYVEKKETVLTSYGQHVRKTPDLEGSRRSSLRFRAQIYGRACYLYCNGQVPEAQAGLSLRRDT